MCVPLSAPVAAASGAAVINSTTVSNTATVTVPATGFDPNPDNNSSTDTDTVLAKIAAVDDAFSGINGADGATTASVLANDSLDGAPPTVGAGGNAVLTPGTRPHPGLSMNADGSITVAPGTPAGAYAYPYRVCEAAEPANCADATATVTVGAPPIVANTDDFGSAPINGGSGGDTATVLANDTLNGRPVSAGDTGNVTLAPGTSPLPGMTMNADGTIHVAVQTRAGRYEYPYTICERLNPSNCSSTTAIVVVSAAPIVANPDDFSGAPINGGSGGDTATVLANDTLNGGPVSVGDGGNVALTPGASPLPGLAMNTDGTISVAAQTKAGRYEYPYTICDRLNPDNCASTTATVAVSAAPIVANPDDFSSAVINGGSGGSTPTVLANDTLNGQPVSVGGSGSVALKPGASPLPNLSMKVDGTISVAPETKAGRYEYPYTICDLLNPDNCASTIATVVVSAAPIIANPDDFSGSPINGGSGGRTVTVLANDTLNGRPVSVGDGGNVALRPGASPRPGLTMNTDGTISVAVETKAGRYEYPYTICDLLNPDNCASATAAVTVVAPAIVANADDFGSAPINGGSGGSTATVLANDTLNGKPVSIGSSGNVALKPGASPLPSLTMHADGTIIVAPETKAGRYDYPYTICEVLNPDNCASTTATVVVSAAPIVANPDDFGAAPINGSSGGSTTTVLANDTLNGKPVGIGSGGNVALKPGASSLPNLVMNADGTIDVAPATRADRYEYPYTICELLNPDNCASTTAVVVVNAAPIVANPDQSTTAQNTPVTVSVLNNDMLNAGRAEPGDVTATVSAAPSHGTAEVVAGNTISYTPAANFSGVDTYGYRICERLNPDNCSETTVSIEVAPNQVTAEDDSAETPANTPVTIPVLANDTSVSAPLDPASVKIVTPPQGTAAVGPEGLVTYTPVPNYLGQDSFTYEVCDLSTPAPVCDTATVSIRTTGSPPVANPVEAVGQAGQPVVIPVLNNDSDPDGNIDPASVLIVGSVDGKTLVVPGEGRWSVNPDGSITFLSEPGFVGQATPIRYTVDDTTKLRSNEAEVRVIIHGEVQLRVTKTATPRDARIGDLVRYTVHVENTGVVDAVDATLLDTPPTGFSYVADSLGVADDDNAGGLAGTNPIRVDRLDIKIGGRATMTYLSRVGAGVRPGTYVNRAVMQQGGKVVSNEAQAEVRLISDPLLDESLLVGTVFNDRDGDGWQDVATLDAVKIKGGFAAADLVPGTTTIDLGKGPQPLAKGSLVGGISLGSLRGRSSEADPGPRIVIGQTLRSAAFSGDFVLSSGNGVGLRMAEDGTTRIERSGRGLKGLDSAMPVVERRTRVVEGGVQVEYIIGNEGIDERGIPGVRIASAEGLLIETDPFGRYHLQGVAGGAERGRNFILKVDPASLPPGAQLTTDNPLVRRITPGIPVRFDFGVRLPPGRIDARKPMKADMKAVMFAPGSARIDTAYEPELKAMAERIAKGQGGEVTIHADGESRALAYERARAVQNALQDRLPSGRVKDLKITLKADGNPLLSLDGAVTLATVLFDTGKAQIKPQYQAMLKAVAADIEQRRGGVIRIDGYADVRGTDAQNQRLSQARAEAVEKAIVVHLGAEAKSRLRVQFGAPSRSPDEREQGGAK
jgi:uncharacterized repeat protein (TIGR01451 family)